MKKDIEACKWFKHRIPIPILLGEVCLWRPHLIGIQSNPDIFNTISLTSLYPPKKEHA